MNTYEMYLYQTIYPPTVQVGYGLNTVPRAICLALWMEYKRIVVLGADCACAPTGTPMPHDIDSPEYVPWLESLRLYADGRTPAKYGPNAVMSQGILEGRFWHTRLGRGSEAPPRRVRDCAQEMCGGGAGSGARKCQRAWR